VWIHGTVLPLFHSLRYTTFFISFSFIFLHRGDTDFIRRASPHHYCCFVGMRLSQYHSMCFVIAPCWPRSNTCVQWDIILSPNYNMLHNSPTSCRQQSKWVNVWYKSRSEYHIQFIPFSAFWLRSSVVSVLISLISDMWPNGSHDIKLLFWGGEVIIIACYWISQVSPMRCTIAWAGSPHQS
jgi:hypothetical protein